MTIDDVLGLAEEVIKRPESATCLLLADIYEEKGNGEFAKRLRERRSPSVAINHLYHYLKEKLDGRRGQYLALVETVDERHGWDFDELEEEAALSEAIGELQEMANFLGKLTGEQRFHDLVPEETP